MKGNTKLTSVKVLDRLYKDFRVKSLSEDFTLQKLVNRSIHKFLTDEDFQLNIKHHRDLKVSGSRF
tara:strand:- start:121 stop:318 length:198 start_codon:yes stop_codon:yes gene_type:complete